MSSLPSTTSDTPLAAPAAMLPTKSKSSSKACRYGTICRNAKCVFRHPNTINPETPSNEMHVASTATTTTPAAATRQADESVPTKAVGDEAAPKPGKNAKKNKKRKDKVAAVASTVPATLNMSETFDSSKNKDIPTSATHGDDKKDLPTATSQQDNNTEHANGGNHNKSKPGKAKKGGPIPREQPGTPKKSAAAVKKLCRHGNKCHSANCRFRHPDVPTDAMNTDVATAAAPPTLPILPPLNNNSTQQQHQQDERPVTVEANRADQPQHVPKTKLKSAAVPPKRAKAKKPCMFGAKCHRPHCKFLHPDTTTTTTTEPLGPGAANKAATVTPHENIDQVSAQQEMTQEPGMWANELEGQAQERPMWASDLEDRMMQEAREAQQKLLAYEQKKVAANEKRLLQVKENQQRQKAQVELQRQEKRLELERQQAVKQQEEAERLQKEEKRKRLEQEKVDKETHRLEEEKERKRLEQEKVELAKKRLQQEKEDKRLELKKIEKKERQRFERDKAEKENKRLQIEEKRKLLEGEAIAKEREEEELEERLKEEKRRRVEMAREQKSAKDRRLKEEGEREKENVESASSKLFVERTTIWEMEREKERKTIDMLVLFCAAEFCRKVLAQDTKTKIHHRALLSDAGARAKLEESCEEAYLELYKDSIISRVLVTGVPQPADINDRAGTIERWSAAKGMYYVGLDPKKNNKQTHFMYFSPGNLRAAPIQAFRKGKTGKKQTSLTCMVFASTLKFGASLMCEVAKSTVERLLATEQSSRDALLSELMAERAEEERVAKEMYRRQQEEERRRVVEDLRREEEAHRRRAEQRRRENAARDKKRQEWEAAHDEYRRYQEERRAAQERAWNEPHDPRCGCPRCEMKRIFEHIFGHGVGDDDDDDGWDDRRYDEMNDEEQAKQDEEAASILGVDVDATDAEIKRQFRRSALKYHPDKYTGAENHVDGMTKQESEDHFKQIVNAYDHLMLQFDE